MGLQYKFVEVAPVTAETLEECVNELVAAGWALEGIRFVMTEGSKRPSMAYVSGTRQALAAVADAQAPRAARPLVQPDVPFDEDPGHRGTP
jgi:hypothetical protein